MKQPLRCITFVIYSFFFLGSGHNLFGQSTKGKYTFSNFGVEIGIGTNDVLNGFSRNLSPRKNTRAFIGLTGEISVSNHINFSTGIRFQQKGTLDFKSNYFLAPAELAILILGRHDFQFAVIGGTALELNLAEQDHPEFLNKPVSLNWRFGLKMSIELETSHTVVFKLLRTRSTTSYTGVAFSPGGNSFSEEYYNLGLEFGMGLLMKI